MDNKILRVYRHEVKFLMSQAEYIQIKSLLHPLVQKDAYSKDNEDYYIRSLYFDTINNYDYNSKIDGLSERKKIRMRIYDTNTDIVKLEVKNKENNYSYKETVSIIKEDAIAVINGDYRRLLKYENEIANKVYHSFIVNGYTPKLLVDYNREAYFMPIENIRLTFDKKIRTCNSKELFDNTLPMFAVMPENTIVLEVKYDKYIPDYISRILSAVTMQNMSISKYCMSRETIGWSI